MSTLAVDLTGRSALVVGTGSAAASAATALLRAGAVVHVLLDGDPGATVEDLADRGQLTVHTGPVSAAQPRGHAVVAARTGDPATDQAVEDAAAAAGVAVLPRSMAETPAGRAGVTILGGGPGDPGLLTLAGYRALAAADVVVADRLAPLAVLDELPRRPLVIDAAKVPGGRSMPQEQINALLVEHALAGRAVVRLKGGDPFVFGRGMEEVQACAAAGVAVDVLPGVTSAISVPGLAGVPVTHRGLTQAFTVVSGHVPPGHPDSQVDWAALARSGATLVLLMAVRTLGDIAAALLEAGMAADTPTATMMDGAGPGASTQRSTLGAVAGLAVRAPAVTVVGAVAGLLTS